MEEKNYFKRKRVKFFGFILIFTLLALLIILPSNSHALDISVGASTWYSWWDMDAPEDQNPEFDPGLLYGPLLSVRFLDDWSIASVFLYGKFGAKQYLTEIKRYDSDTSLSYSVNRYLKVFAGFKYMGFEWDNEEGSGGGSHKAMGSGLGLAVTAPLADAFFLLFNISGIYVSGEEKQDDFWPGMPNGSDLTETGGNSTISLAYYIQEISTTITLGFRAQYVKINYENNDYASDADMTFYGATLSAVYSFDI